MDFLKKIQYVLDPIISHIIGRIFPYILISCILFIILIILTSITFYTVIRTTASAASMATLATSAAIIAEATH